jgi:hypothetical protein
MRKALATNGIARLSDYGHLDPAQYRDLLDLICAALALPADAEGTRYCRSADGQVELVLHRLDTPRACRLTTDGGVLTAPDFRLSVRLRGVDVLTGQSARRATAATAG